MMIVALDEGHGRLRLDPPDFDLAASFYRSALELSKASGDRGSLALRALAMTAAGRGDDDALFTCHEALAALYAIRRWQKVWQVLDSVIVALAAAGELENAAVILGHLEANMPSYGVEGDLGFAGGWRRHSLANHDSLCGPAAARR